MLNCDDYCIKMEGQKRKVRNLNKNKNIRNDIRESCECFLLPLKKKNSMRSNTQDSV